MKKILAGMLVGALVLMAAPGTFGGPGAVDSDGPQITVTAPDLDAWHRGLVTVEADIVAEPSLQWARAQLEGGPWLWNSFPPHEWTWDTTPYDDGGLELHIQARDNDPDTGGRYTSLFATLKVDNTPPMAEIVAPNNGTIAILGGTFGTTVQVEASDETSGVERVDFYVDGEYQDSVYEKPYEWQYQALLQFGEVEVTAVAVDRAGNEAQDSVTFFALG